MVADGLMMKLQSGEVLKGIGSCQVAGLDQAHETVAYVGPVLGFEEQSVLAMEDGPLEYLFAKIVMKGGPLDLEEQGQGVPVSLHVADGLTQRGVRLDRSLIKLLLQPLLQLLHQGVALGLMEGQPFGR